MCAEIGKLVYFGLKLENLIYKIRKYAERLRCSSCYTMRQLSLTHAQSFFF